MSDPLPIIEQVNATTEELPKTLTYWMGIYTTEYGGWCNSIMFPNKEEAANVVAYHIQNGKRSMLVKITIDI